MKKSVQIILLFTVCLLVTFSSSLQVQANQDKSAEVDKYITMLNSASLKTRVDAAKYITRSGLTDSRLFNFVEEKLLSGYNIDTMNSDHIDEMSWMCKALASSGSTNYTPTLEKIIETTKSSKLKKYAQQSLSLLPEYAKKNQMMNDKTNHDPNLSPEVNKYINMLQSDIITLKRDAAKAIYRGDFAEKPLFDTVRDELLKEYKNTSMNDRNHIDALAWMCKALASSGMVEYRQTLTEVIEKSSSMKLQKYAKQSLKALQ